jgi:hypothetical protein
MESIKEINPAAEFDFFWTIQKLKRILILSSAFKLINFSPNILFFIEEIALRYDTKTILELYLVQLSANISFLILNNGNPPRFRNTT